jgi:hypothetical protein
LERRPEDREDSDTANAKQNQSKNLHESQQRLAGEVQDAQALLNGEEGLEISDFQYGSDYDYESEEMEEEEYPQ